ncbi:MAG: hypothetical protein EA341_13635, partial [Mongoliibacter sp.]|uniref:hypothetical protein n=1 Tax=Mongoliibacter sp. TaxID=2022438 RepID=UPI0012EF16C7
MVDRLLKKELDSIFTFSKVKLYFDQDHLCEGYFFDLFVSIHSEKIQLADEGEKYFELVNSVEEADFIFIPIPLSDLLGRAGGRKCIQYHDSLASTFQKTLVMVSDADLLFDPGVENYLLLTPGPYKSMKQQMAIPALLQQDPLKKWFNGQWKPVSKQKEISVGFCGQATSNFLKNIKDHLQYFWLNGEKLLGKSKHLYIPFFLAAKERADLLDTLEQSSVIKTDFLKRERYKGGAKSDEDQKRLEFEFFK